MTSFSSITFWFLFMLSSTLASENQSRINVTLIGSVTIRDGSNSVKHFVPRFSSFKTKSSPVVLGLPSVRLNWTMWRSVTKPTMRIFGIQHSNEWYFLKASKNGRSLIVFKQSIQDMVSTNSSLWFQYAKIPTSTNKYSLYHQQTQSYVAIINSKLELSNITQIASGIDIWQNLTSSK